MASTVGVSRQRNCWLAATQEYCQSLVSGCQFVFIFKWSLPELSCAIAADDLVESVIPDKLSLRARWLIYIIDKQTVSVGKFQFMREGHLRDFNDFL